MYKNIIKNVGGYLNKKNIILSCSLLIIFAIFSAWFSKSLVTSGDFSFYYTDALKNWSIIPFAWHLERGSGLGGSYAFLLWEHVLRTLPITLFNKFGVNWIYAERLVFLYPFLILSVFSSYLLSSVLNIGKSLKIITILIFIVNTYLLMVIQGGQISIALAYVMSPLVIIMLIRLIESANKNMLFKFLKYGLILGLLLSAQVALDIRIFYITFFAIIILAVIHMLSDIKNLVRIFKIIIFSLLTHKSFRLHNLNVLMEI